MSRALWAVCGAAFALCACTQGVTLDGGVDAGQKVSPVDACNRLAAARCGVLQRCYTAFVREAADDCVTLQQSQCLADYELLQTSFDNNSVEIDGTHLSQCEERMAGSACPPSFPPGYPNIAAHPFDDCDWGTGLLIGEVKTGTPCVNAVDCEAGSLCAKPNGVCEGTCTTRATNGSPCALGCAAGLRCDDNGTPDNPNDDLCAPLKELNDSCNDSNECDSELVCNLTCRPRGKAGEPCIFDTERLSTCDPGLACDVTPFVAGAVGTCILPQPEFSPCQFHWSCTPGLVCADLDWANFPAMSPSPGQCRPPDDKDVHCNPTLYEIYVGDPCVAGTYCASATSTCSTVPMMGDMCDPVVPDCAGVDVYCKPGAGTTGTCTGPAGIGDRCAFQIDASNTVTIPCQMGYCDTQSTLTCRAPFRADNDICTVDGECMSGRCFPQTDMTQRCVAACN